MSTVAEIVLDSMGDPYVNWYETGKDFYDQYPVGTKFCAKEPSLEESIAELKQENRLLRARNDRLKAYESHTRASCEFLTDDQLKAGVNEWFNHHNIDESFERRMQSAIKVALNFKEKL